MHCLTRVPTFRLKMLTERELGYKPLRPSMRYEVVGLSLTSFWTMCPSGLMIIVYIVPSYHVFGEIEVFLVSILTIFACGQDPIFDRVEEK